MNIEKSNEGVYTFNKSNDNKNEPFISPSPSNSLYILKDQLTCSSYLLEAQYDKVQGHLSTPITGGLGDQEDQSIYLTML